MNQIFAKFIFFLIIIFLFGCKENESIKNINKTTIITYLGQNRVRCETIIVIPKGISYDVRSDGLSGNLDLINISVSKNGIQLPPNMYSLDSRYIENVYNPIYGRINAVFKSIRFKSISSQNFHQDSIYLSYDILVASLDSLEKFDFIQLFMSESFPSTDPIINVNSQLIQRTLSNYFIPYFRNREGMKTAQGNSKYELKYFWQIKSEDLFHQNTLSPYQAIGFVKNSNYYIGGISQTLDLSKFSIVKDIRLAKVKGTPSSRPFEIMIKLNNEISNPIISSSVNIDGVIHQFYPDTNYFNEDENNLSFSYYFGSSLSNQNKNIYKHSGNNLLVFSFPLVYNSIAEFRAEIVYPSKSILLENDPFNFTIKYPTDFFNPQQNSDIFTIIIPDNCYFQFIPYKKFLVNFSEHELTYKGLQNSDFAFTPLSFRFNKMQAQFFNIIIWINRFFIFIVLIYIIINIFNLKFLQDRITYNLIGKFILSGFLLEILKHFDIPNFWDGFLYTETYLYLLSVVIWYYSTHIVKFIKNILRFSD